MRNSYNIINVTALERLPEKHYAHENWSPEQKTTQILLGRLTNSNSNNNNNSTPPI